MTIKNLPSSALDVLRGGFVRFAPFNIFAFIGAIYIIWYNHAPPSEAGTLGVSGSVVVAKTADCAVLLLHNLLTIASG